MLGEAVRLIRVYHDLKQKQVAERLDISTSYLSEIEKGHKTPSLELIQRYSDTFGLPVSSTPRVEEGGASDRTRTFVAGKMVGLLQFLDERPSCVQSD